MTVCLVQQNPDESEVLTDVQKKELEELCETKSAEGKVLLEVRPSVRFIYLRHEIGLSCNWCFTGKCSILLAFNIDQICFF